MSSKQCARCRQLHTERGQYCPRCQDVKKKTVTASPPKSRDPFYGTNRWRKTAKRQLKIEPLCRTCKDKGIVTAGKYPDHIVEVRDGGAKYDHTNLQTLCAKCHGKKTAAERKERNRL